MMALLFACGSLSFAQQPAAQSDPAASQPKTQPTPAPRTDQSAPTKPSTPPVTAPTPVTTSNSSSTSPLIPPPAATTPQEPVSVELMYWFTNAQPNLYGGAANTFTGVTGLDFTGKGKRSPGINIGIPAGPGNSIHISYFQATGTGNQTAATDLTLFNTALSQGDYLATRYKLQNVKISLDFLSYPTPLGDSSWRFRTLWEVQYTTINSSIDAPFRTVSYDSSGTAISNTASGTRWFIYPTLGAAIDKNLTKRFKVEAKASGFGIPKRADIWDAEASATYNLGPIDVIGAYRGFHFKTSPKNEQYLSETLSGAYVALRWSWKLK